MKRIVALKKMDPMTLGVSWDDGLESRYDVMQLRDECACAQCRDEWTGQKIPKQSLPGQLPTVVFPVTIESIGQYGLKIVWSDGHKAGIFTYEQLRQLAQLNS